MGEKIVSLKLLIDTQSKRVLFAEAGKEFVDFLFHMISLPLGTIVKLLKVKGMVGSLGALYKSIRSLSIEYFQPNLNKHVILKPAAVSAVSVPLLSLQEATTSVDRSNLYGCGSKRRCACITKISGTACPSCSLAMHLDIRWHDPPGAVAGLASSSSVGAKGYVKGVVTYMVMDNLEVKPMSTISGITLINKLHVKDVSALIEKQVEIGLTEGLAILKASLETSDVLTTVFVAK